jgi:hypothetical protein
MRVRVSATNAFGLLLILAALLLVACGGGENATDPLTIGPDGGVVDGPGGLLLDIPLGALSESVTLSISESAMPAQTELTQVSRFYRIEPIDTAFTIPATLRIPYNPDAIGERQREQDVRLYVGRDLTGGASMLAGEPDLENALAIGTITTLGIFGAAVPPPDAPLGAPNLTAPDLVDFGLVAVNDSDTQNLIFGNTGQTDLTLESVRLENGTGFSLSQPPAAGTLIPALSQIQVALSFAPTSQADYAAELVIDSDDPTTPKRRIPVRGRGAGLGRIAAEPERLDFGDVWLGESKDLALTVRNSGSGTLKVFSATLSATSVFELQSPSLPTQIAAGDAITLSVTFSPVQAEDVQVDLNVESDDLDQPILELVVSGRGQNAPIDGDLDAEDESEIETESESEIENDTEPELEQAS